MFLIIWEFYTTPDREEEFESAYGTEGIWVTLFRKGTGYLRTEFLKDPRTEHRYVTIDMWTSQEEYETFKEHFHQEYALIDRQCESSTVSERFIGSFKIQE